MGSDCVCGWLGPACHSSIAPLSLATCVPNLPLPLPSCVPLQDVDAVKGTITYLAPCAGPLPGSLLLAGSFKTYLD